MKKVAIFAVLAFLLVFCATPALANGGPPSLPHAFYGSVEINGTAAPSGTQVSATVDNGTIVSIQNPVTTAAGSYGTTSPKLLVQGDIPPGATITFHVTNANGTAVGGAATFKAGGGPTLVNLSVTIAAPPTPPPVGVGGGPSPAPPTGITDVRGKVTATGVFIRDITATSKDALCTLTIPKGTVGLSGEQPLKEISMLVMDEPPPPPEEGNVIGLAYDFQPSGATFDPPITLTFSYDPADIPEGIAEEDLVIAYYDEAGEWIELEGCVIDPKTNTITASVSHFTAFVVAFIPVPAAFSISSLEISPAEVEIGDMITIGAVVENTGGMKGISKVTLEINGEVEQIKYVVLGSGASARVSFAISRDVAGSYSVDVNGLTDSFTVKAPPELAPAPAPAPPTPSVPPVPPAEPVNWPVVGVITAGVVIAVLGIFFLVRRRA